jgi:hypothetical protein
MGARPLKATTQKLISSNQSLPRPSKTLHKLFLGKIKVKKNSRKICFFLGKKKRGIFQVSFKGIFNVAVKKFPDLSKF